jgi:hypothetical protein
MVAKHFVLLANRAPLLRVLIRTAGSIQRIPCRTDIVQAEVRVREIRALQGSRAFDSH